MNCNLEIHNDLKSMGEICCPFCDEKLQDCSVKYHSCCDIQDNINDNGTNVCQSCGSVHCYDVANEYINFHENKGK